MSIKKTFTRSIILCIVSLTLTVCLTTSALGQIPTLPQFNNVNKFFTRSNRSGQIGNVVYGAVMLDGRAIFFVAVPAAIQEEKKDNQVSLLDQRIERIENNLREILKRGFDPETLQVSPSVLNGSTVILVSDQNKLKRQVVRTITQADAQLYAQSIEEILPEVLTTIRDALLNAYKERQPESLKRQAIWAGKLFLAIAIVSFIIISLQKLLKARLIEVKKHITKLNNTKKQPVYLKATEQDRPGIIITLINGFFDYLIFAPHYYFSQEKNKAGVDKNYQRSLSNFIAQPEYFLNNKQLEAILQKQIKLELLFRNLLIFGQFFLWLQWVSFTLFLFPYTRRLGLQLAGTPFSLLFIWLGITVAIKITDFLVDLLFIFWEEDLSFIHGLSERQTLRVPTIASALKSVVAVILIGIGIILSLQTLNIPIVPILTTASILGVGVSFGSQHMVKDIISGVINLINDSYAVGDRVIIGADDGHVEHLNLFVTKLRNINGDLITIPNGLVGIVKNQTKDWSRVDFHVEVNYETDVKKALIVLQEVADSLCSDPQWQKLILEPPDLKGIEALSHQGITLRVCLKTVPGKQWSVGRELRLRLNETFSQAGIEIMMTE